SRQRTGNLRILLRQGATADPGDNRRRQRRGAAGGPPGLMALDSGGRTTRSRRSGPDLRPRGLQIRSRVALSNGARPRLLIGVTAPWPLQLAAEVVWVREDDDGWQAGIRFLDVSEQNQQALLRLVFNARWKAAG